jgi:hypothetical protein
MMGTGLGVIFPFVLSGALGLAVCLNLGLERPLRRLLLWASPAVGIGLSALLFFVWSLVFYPGFASAVYFGVEMLLALAGLAVYYRRRRRLPVEQDLAPAAKTPWEVMALRLALGITALLAVVYMVMRQAKAPYGEWDSWAIWTMRARYLFLGQTEWRNAFSEFLHGSDYPVLISFYIARNWTLLGQSLQIVPQLVGIVFGLNTAGFLLEALRQARGEVQGLLGAFVLTATPTFLYWSANQYADVPLGFFILVTMACLYFYARRATKPPALLFMAGLASSLASWSKNEGAFLLGGVAVVGFLGLFLKSPGHKVRNWGWFMAGLLPGLALLAVFKLTLAPESYVMRQTAGELLAKIRDADRTDLIWQQFKEEVVNFGVWRLSLAGVLLGYGVLAGPDLKMWRKEGKILAGIGLVLILVLCGFLAAYQITTLPLEWQLRKSMERLLLQVFPLGLFWMFLLVRNPLNQDEGEK